MAPFCIIKLLIIVSPVGPASTMICILLLAFVVASRVSLLGARGRLLQLAWSYRWRGTVLNSGAGLGALGAKVRRIVLLLVVLKAIRLISLRVRVVRKTPLVV